jgi:hypothetical protein
MERAFAAIHEAHLRQPAITLVYGTAAGQIGLMLRCAQVQQALVLDPIIASYPQCAFTAIEEPGIPAETATWSREVTLRPELFPILRHSQFEDLLNHNFADPVSSLLRAIRPDNSITCQVEISISPASHRRCHTAVKAVRRLDREFFRNHHRLARFYARNILRGRWQWLAWILGRIAIRSAIPGHTLLETSTSRLHEREEDLQGAADKIGGHLFEARLRLVVHAPPDLHAFAAERLQGMAAALGAFTKSRLARFHAGPIRRGIFSRGGKQFLLSHEELATLWHPPTATAAAEKMQTSDFTELEAPAIFHSEREEGNVILGRVRFRDDQRIIPLALEDRRRHLYICGKTGMGKTTLIQNMIVSDMLAGRGVCLVDPHGDLAESIVALVPRQRTNDVVLFDAADRSMAIPFNPLACRDPSRIDQVTSGVVSAFKKLNDSWGPRLEDTLRNAVFATVEQGGNLLSVMRLLGEQTYREQTVVRIRDEVVRSFWMHEFAGWSDNYRTEAVAAIQNKLRPFVVSTNIRAIVTHTSPSLDLRQIMDEGKVLIVNLSKGRLGEDNSTLLGAFLVTSIQQAAMTRADIPETDRRDFYLYVDEFQNFTTGSFASVLSEARKYRLGLIVAHQYLSQLDEETADAVWGNVGSIVAFQVGSVDAEMLARQLGKFEGQMTPQNLTGLPKYTAYARLLIDGMPSNPFSLQTLPPPSTGLDPERADIIRRVVRRRFATDAAGTESARHDVMQA